MDEKKFLFNIYPGRDSFLITEILERLLKAHDEGFDWIKIGHLEKNKNDDFTCYCKIIAEK